MIWREIVEVALMGFIGVLLVNFYSASWRARKGSKPIPNSRKHNQVTEAKFAPTRKPPSWPVVVGAIAGALLAINATINTIIGLIT